LIDVFFEDDVSTSPLDDFACAEVLVVAFVVTGSTSVIKSGSSSFEVDLVSGSCVVIGGGGRAVVVGLTLLVVLG
jgi:hypothetical protein